MSQKTKNIVLGAQIGAIYAALCWLQELLVPGSASQVLQLRVAESLMVLALLTPAAVPGLSVGCLLFNISTFGALPLDVLVGTAATGFSAWGMWLLRRVRIKNWPLPALLLPAGVNGAFVGWEMSLLTGDFWLSAGYIALSEAIVLLTLGTALHRVLEKLPLFRN